MALECAVRLSFRPGDRTPESVKWEGILEWSDPARPSPNGHTRVLRLQCGMRMGPNGFFLTMPYVRKVENGRIVAARGNDGKYRNYADVGWEFQQTGVEAVMRWLTENPGHGATITGPTALSHSSRTCARRHARRSRRWASRTSMATAAPATPSATSMKACRSDGQQDAALHHRAARQAR